MLRPTSAVSLARVPLRAGSATRLTRPGTAQSYATLRSSLSRKGLRRSPSGVELAQAEMALEEIRGVRSLPNVQSRSGFVYEKQGSVAYEKLRINASKPPPRGMRSWEAYHIMPAEADDETPRLTVLPAGWAR